MELNKTSFLKNNLLQFNLTEEEQNQIIKKALEEWDMKFDFLPGKDIMPFLIENGIEHELAFKIMESLRKGNGLTSEWEAILLEKNISLDFIKKHENTIPTSPIGVYFSDFLNQKVQEVKQ